MNALRVGATLIELLITLALLGVIAAIVSLSNPRPKGRDDAMNAIESIQEARSAALRFGRQVMIQVRVDDRLYEVSAQADGSLLADSTLGFDRTSGKRRRDARLP